MRVDVPISRHTRLVKRTSKLSVSIALTYVQRPVEMLGRLNRYFVVLALSSIEEFHLGAQLALRKLAAVSLRCAAALLILSDFLPTLESRQATGGVCMIRSSCDAQIRVRICCSSWWVKQLHDYLFVSAARTVFDLNQTKGGLLHQD